MKKLLDRAGERYGRLTVVSRWERLPSGHSKWLCICDCGNTKIVEDSNLKRSEKISCGCWRKELYKESGKYIGQSRTNIYKIWASMVKRCTKANATNYKYYGGRGIKVCDDWLDDKNGFFLFKNWAYENGYQDGLSIERIDVNGDYTPDNCTWVTWTEQCKNKRSNHYLTLNGVTKTLTDWAKYTGINRGTITSRLKRGWSVEKALTVNSSPVTIKLTESVKK